MDSSAEKLLVIARKYWPAEGDYNNVERPLERQRLDALWDEKLREQLDHWHGFLDGLDSALPDFVIGDGTTASDGGFRLVAYAKSPRSPPRFRFALVGCVSILAPLYTVFGVQYDFIGRKRHNPRLSFEPLPFEMRAPADLLARKMEATFDVRRLPREVADMPIPLFVHNVEPPKTTLFHALFDSQPDNLP